MFNWSNTLGKRAKIWSLVVGLVAIALGIAVYNLNPILTYLCNGEDEIAELKFNSNSVVVISAERCWENARAIYYEVKTDDRTVVQPTYLSSVDADDLDNVRLRVLSSEDGSVLGVVEEKLP